MGLRHRGTVQLETERLILRRFLPGDMEEIYNNCWRDYEVWRWTSYDPMPTIREVQTAAAVYAPMVCGLWAARPVQLGHPAEKRAGHRADFRHAPG